MPHITIKQTSNNVMIHKFSVRHNQTLVLHSSKLEECSVNMNHKLLLLIIKDFLHIFTVQDAT